MVTSQNSPEKNDILSKMTSMRFGRILLRVPIIARWALKKGLPAEKGKYREQKTLPIPPITGTDAHADSQSVLDGITRDVVKILGFSAAAIAIYEKGDALTMRSLYIDRDFLSAEQLQKWEFQLSYFTEYPFQLSSPQVMRFYPNDSDYQKNIAVQAANSGEIQTSKNLYDLFHQILPLSTRPIVQGIQHSLAIDEIVAVPFSLHTVEKKKAVSEYVGNLFVASKKPIKESQRQILLAFTRHIALTILSERRHTHVKLTQRLALNAHRHFMDEQKVLDAIAEGIVNEMGYAGAMVAPYENGGALPVEAIYIDPTLVSLKQIRAWEAKVSSILPQQKKISLFDPQLARVYMNDPRYENNLSVRAAIAREPIVSNELFDLFTPLVPRPARSLIMGYQRKLGIRQVISVPFFLDDEFIGNLFAATRSREFTLWEIDALQTFGYQAAAGLRNARLYKQAEDRQAATEILGRMAFSAAASVHTMRNHVGVIRGNLQLLDNIDALAADNESRRELFEKLVPPITNRLGHMAVLLDSLRSPWAMPRTEKVNVNRSLLRALSKATDDSQEWIHKEISAELPQIDASEEILIEILRGIIKNSVESLAEKGEKKFLWIESHLKNKDFIEINIQDSGTGIKAEELSQVFDIFWSTKPRRIGLGLFWARDYIEGLGGSVTLDSTWGEGTTCTLLLPVQTREYSAKYKE